MGTINKVGNDRTTWCRAAQYPVLVAVLLFLPGALEGAMDMRKLHLQVARAVVQSSRVRRQGTASLRLGAFSALIAQLAV